MRSESTAYSGISSGNGEAGEFADLSIEAIDRLLPQMQCGRCGYAACRPYAEALAGGKASVTLCTPGGPTLAAALSARLSSSGATADAEPIEIMPPPPALQIAAVVEPDCIGCTKCIQVCPVDAIVGAAHQMHSVLTSRCTGCELCVPACPVDCILLESAPFVWDQVRADRARRHFEARNRRLACNEPVVSPQSETERLQAEVAAAVARVRARREGLV